MSFQSRKLCQTKINWVYILPCFILLSKVYLLHTPLKARNVVLIVKTLRIFKLTQTSDTKRKLNVFAASTQILTGMSHKIMRDLFKEYSTRKFKTFYIFKCREPHRGGNTLMLNEYILFNCDLHAGPERARNYII